MSQTPSTEPWTVGRLLTWTTQFFQSKQVEGGRLAAELLLARALGCRKIELYTRFESEPTDDQRAAFRELTKQAADHVPIAYLLGSREFFSMDFEVTPAVLIPRPETEILVQRVVQLCREGLDRTWNILDIGTGSGCIAIAIAKYAPNAHVTGSDISPDALAVAERNVQKHPLTHPASKDSAVTPRVRLVQADLAALPAEAVPDGGFDVIVSNPPYISEPVYATLQPNVRHEPKLALLAGPDGLAMYRRLATEAPPILAPHGRILVEFAHDQHDPVKAIFDECGAGLPPVKLWTFVATHRDRTDPHHRAIEFRRT